MLLSVDLHSPDVPVDVLEFDPTRQALLPPFRSVSAPERIPPEVEPRGLPWHPRSHPLETSRAKRPTYRASDTAGSLPQPRAVPLPEEAPVATASHGHRVLIIEDNTDGRETLRILLRLWGHEVEAAD